MGKKKEKQAKHSYNAFVGQLTAEMKPKMAEQAERVERDSYFTSDLQKSEASPAYSHAAPGHRHDGRRRESVDSHTRGHGTGRRRARCKSLARGARQDHDHP